MGRYCRSIVFTMGVLLVSPVAWAGPQLWLYPQEAGPRQGGHIVPPGEFTLVVENQSKTSDENTAQDVQLVVAINDTVSIANLALAAHSDGSPIELGDWTYGIPMLPCSEKPMPRHGVYPAYHAFAALGDLAGGERYEIDVVVEGEADLRVHFDAVAIAWRHTGKGPKCSDVSNPAGHDVSVGERPGGHDECGRVTITKTSEQKFVDFGDIVIFEIEIINDGACDLTEPVLRDYVPTVKGDDGSRVPAFKVLGGTDPTPSEDDGYLLEWPLTSPFASGEQRGVRLEVEFDEPAADGRRVVNRACVSAEELRKPRCAAAVVFVGNPRGDSGPAGPGFWCHATRFIFEERWNAPIEAEDFEAWLSEIGDSSEVFHEPPYDASTLELAHDWLCTPQSAEGAADRLVRHLLTLWLNVVSGRVALGQALDELCDGDELMPEDVVPATVWELIVAVEEALLLPADDQELGYWSEVVDAVNNSLLPGEPGCVSPLATTGRRRAGHGKAKVMSAVPGAPR
jgi:uncharacterized repeat protein (TIGR01451 family)